MAEAWVYREPSTELSRHPPTVLARLPQRYARGYDQTAHMDRLGQLRPRIVAPTFTPHQGLPLQRHGNAPPPPRPGIVRDIRAIALGVIFGLAIVAVAIAVSRGFSL